MFVEKISNDGRFWDDEITRLYKGRRNCFIDCAYILNGIVKTDKQYCYYNINPFEFIDSYYSVRRFNVDSSSNIALFNFDFKDRFRYELIRFEKRLIDYTNLVVEYNATLIEKEIDELSAVEEDKINLIKLIALNDKKDMNSDIFQVIYNNLISDKGTNIFIPYLANLDNDKNFTIAQIISS
jgi:hypothetical protein